MEHCCEAASLCLIGLFREQRKEVANIVRRVVNLRIGEFVGDPVGPLLRFTDSHSESAGTGRLQTVAPAIQVRIEEF